jgi:hypothetical protein
LVVKKADARADARASPKAVGMDNQMVS